MDPPREGVAEAVQSFRNAHVQTVMITGDHVDTALAIAKELGIAQSHEQCMRGEELEVLSQEELIGRVEGIRVFARVSPEHKVRIVTCPQSKGQNGGHDRRRDQRCPGAALGRCRCGDGKGRNGCGAECCRSDIDG